MLSVCQPTALRIVPAPLPRLALHLVFLLRLVAPATALQGVQLSPTALLRDGAVRLVRLSDVAVGAVAKNGSSLIKNEGGQWVEESLVDFLRLLLKDLSADQAKTLRSCGAHMKGDPNARNLGMDKQVWIIVNEEHKSGQEAVVRLRSALPRSARVLVLGNRWDDAGTADYRGPWEEGGPPHVVSLWVPVASLAFMDQHGRTPLDLIDRARVVESLRSKDDVHIVAYQHDNCAVRRREEFWDRLCQEMAGSGRACHSLGYCNGKLGLGSQDAENNEGRWSQTRDDNTVQRLARYKFAVALENKFPNTRGYVTEKMLNALLAGTVPIYGGATHATEVFDPSSFVRYEGRGEEALARVAELLGNETAYKAMVSQPAVSAESMRRFFSWHPAVWPAYGDGLRRQILGELAALCSMP